jgi:hypothetical protein
MKNSNNPKYILSEIFTKTSNGTLMNLISNTRQINNLLSYLSNTSEHDQV